jgi:hypothetical protein
LKHFSIVFVIFVLTTMVANPSYSDDVTINLDSTTPYVDVPVTITEPVDATVSTVTGTPQTNPGFVDSWIEIWQGAIRLAYNDDGAHSATNILASIITMPLTAGEYFIRATSYAYMCCNYNLTGSYLLSTNLTVSTPTPSPTVTEPTPEPSPSPTETVTPTPSPSETSSEQPTPEPSQTPSETPSQPENPPDQDSSPVVQPFPESLPSVPVEVSPEVVVPTEPDVSVQPVEDLTSTSFPSSLENDLLSLENSSEDISAIDEILSLLSFLPEFSIESLQETFQQISESISTALESIPGGEQVLAAIQSVNNLGSEYTPEERKQAQQVVLGAIIVSQLANPRRVK